MDGTLVISVIAVTVFMLVCMLNEAACSSKRGNSARRNRRRPQKRLGLRAARRLFEERLRMKLDAFDACKAMLREAEAHQNDARFGGSPDGPCGKSG